MKMRRSKKALSFILCFVLIVAMALTTTGCNGNARNNDEQKAQVSDNGVFEDGEVLGEGEKEFSFTVVDMDGNETNLTIHTDADTVGEALLELGVLDGEEGPYGLFVKTVNGITADYDEDGAYWAFYINGEYAMSGVELTDITEGEHYTFKVEKA